MGLSADTLDSYFEQFGWTYNRTSETSWVTGVRTSVASFRIFIRLSEHWVYFVINPFVVTPQDPDDRFRFYYTVLRLNLDMNMTKFGLDSDGDLFLAVEMPTEDFTYSHFSDALNALSHHAERHYSNVFNLAHNPDLVDGPYDEELEASLGLDLEDDDYDDLDEDLEATGDVYNGDELSAEDASDRPLDDIDLPEETASSDDRAIIAGREVKIVDDEKGMRIEFETMHDLDDDLPPKDALDDAIKNDIEPETNENGKADDPSHSAEGPGPPQRDGDESDQNLSAQIDDDEDPT
jgi:hypothetical protein